MEVSRAYRQLLRAVTKRVCEPQKDRVWRDAVAAEFRKTVQAPVLDKLQLAKDYAFLLNSVHEQKELLASYNIGIDRQARQREDIQKSAARAGLSIPPHWDDSSQKKQADGKKARTGSG